MAVFALFSTDKPDWSVEEAAAEIGASPSSTYRYFRTLAEAGLIVAMNAGRYVLGPRIIILDRKMRRSDPLILATVEVIARFEDTIAVPGLLLLCRLFRDEVVCVHSQILGDAELQVSYERGRPMPLFRGAVSRVVLANLPTRNVRRLFEDDPSQFANAKIGQTWLDVKRNLRATREAGTVVGYGEVDPGMIGVAGPLFSADRTVIGSLGFVCRSDFIEEVRADVSGAIARMAVQIGTSLGATE